MHPSAKVGMSFGVVNRMTIARFERIIGESGMAVERLQIHPTLGLRVVTRVPILRELLTSAATCILRPRS